MARALVRPSKLKGEVRVPPSKSYTHRAVILASLCDGVSKVDNPLLSGDTLATIEGCKALGASVELQSSSLIIKGRKHLHTPHDVIDVQNSGTTLRFLTAAASLCKEGYTVLTGDESIRRRPMQPLLDALSTLGVECWSTRLNGLAPIVVKGGGIEGGKVKLQGHISSQFISALLITTPKARRETRIDVEGKMVSKPYVDATIETIRAFFGMVERTDRGFLVQPNQDYRPTHFMIPGDFSSASFLLAGAALTGGNVKVIGLDFSLPQADTAIIKILDKMGSKVMVNEKEGSVMVEGNGWLEGGEVDLSDSPDLLPVVSVLGLKAKERVKIKGVAHTRLKESDRISVLAKELRKFGADTVELDDGLVISAPKTLESCEADAHNDHRIFMALVLAAMVTKKGCLISGVETVHISYPSFLNDIKALGCDMEVVNSG